MEDLEKRRQEGEDTLRRNQDYEPSREADKYILDRMLENLPGMRPDTDPGRAPANSPEEPRPVRYLKKPEYRMAPAKSPGYYAAKQNQEGTREPSLLEELQGWKDFEEALKKGRASGYEKKFSRDKARGTWNWPKRSLHPQEKKQIEELEGLLAERAAAPGASPNREGRIQEIIEALDLTNPESGGRALLRELKRRMIDDRVPRIRAGWKSVPGEEVLKDKLIEMELMDIPRNRHAAMQALGWSSVPEMVKLTDEAGSPIPSYADEPKAAREAAAEKAYMQHRRDPMKDTPERD